MSKRVLDVNHLPFQIDRTRADSLVRQMTDGLRTAIATGFFKPGERLPTIHEWTKALGVSIRVPEAALANLSREGLVVTRPRHGTFVQERGAPSWRGHVLMVRLFERGCYLGDTQMNAALETFSEAGYIATSVTIRRKPRGGYDFSQFDLEISRTVGFVVVFGAARPVVAHIAAAGVPFVDFAPSGRTKGCVGHVTTSAAAANLDFIAHCRRRGVRRVLLVDKENSGGHLLCRGLENVGIEVVRMTVKAEMGPLRVENLEREACRAFDARFEAEGRGWLPDVVYFDDDFVATGALFSLLAHGVRIPGNVGFVTVRHIGQGPSLPCAITSIEYDPAAVGVETARATMRYLETGTFSFSDTVSPRYVIGETFR